LPETELAVRFEDMRWDAAPEGLPGLSVERLSVYEVIKAEGPIFPAAIAGRLRIERTSAQHLVRALVGDGLVRRVVGGYIVDDPGLDVPAGVTH
jgi:DNA-binding MarR family transcriptional regulator